MNRTLEERRQEWVLFGSAVFACLGLAWLLVALPPMQETNAWTIDFVAYRDAALRLVDGGSPYSPRSLAGPFLPFGSDLYLYPPTMALAFTPVARMALGEGAVVWYLLHVGSLALAAALMPVRAHIRLLALGLASLSLSVLMDSMNGNVSTMLLLPAAAAWRWLDRPAGSVAMALAISVRTTFGLFLVWQALRRAWRPLLWTITVGAVLVLVTLPMLGVEAYRDYLTMLRHVSVAGEIRSSDLAATALHLGLSASSAWMANILGWAIAVGAVVLSLRRDREVGFMVTLGASLLTAPLMWEHYLTLVMLTGAFLASRGRPWGMGLLVLTWLPRETLSFVAIAATLLPFLARDAEDVTTSAARSHLSAPSQDRATT